MESAARVDGDATVMHPLFARLGAGVGVSAGGGGGGGGAGGGRRPHSGAFQRESTRLRSNVADQVQRDLLPAGRLLSVFLVLCELLAEAAVLAATWGERCDRPLRFWVCVLMTLQIATVALHCVNIAARDAFSPHRAGLSASDPDMYEEQPRAGAGVFARLPFSVGASTRQGAISVSMSIGGASAAPTPADARSSLTDALAAGPTPGDSWAPPRPDDDGTRRPDFIDRYVRIVNALYLLWYIFGSVWVSGGGTCHATAPHLYRLVVALTIIYYALLFLPLACFCLIVCCLPLFILVYRIMLPYAERERRRARAVDPAVLQSLSKVTYQPSTFPALSGSDSIEDASCVICLCDYEPGEQILFLPCKHHFHQECISRWLALDKACCLCKQDIDTSSPSDVNAV